MVRQVSLGLLLMLVTLTACNLNEVDTAPEPAPDAMIFRAEANRDAAFIVRDGERETLSLIQQAAVTASDGLAVDEDGRATLSLAEFFTAELLQAGQIEIKSAARSDGIVEIVIQKGPGLLLSQFTPEGAGEDRLTIQTNRAAITTAAARFIVTRSADDLEWIVNLGPADQIVEVTAGEETHSLPGGTARWIAPDGLVSSELRLDPLRVEAWFDTVQNGSPRAGLAEVILPPADVMGNVLSLTALPSPGQPFELGRNEEQGPVELTLDPIGLFGAPTYTLEDCNDDGVQELAVLAGKIHFDFSGLLAQVRALDATIVNRDLPGNGALWAVDVLGEEVARQLFEVGGGDSQTLSLRSQERYHSAQLAMIDGCFVGFSLTPPTPAGTPAPPRAVTTLAPPQRSAVVNVLAQAEAETGPESEPVGRRRETNQLQAWPLAAGEDSLEINGEISDWNVLARQNRANWTRFSAVTYDQACSNRFPGAASASDLQGQVLFAYDDRSLYVAFQVDDDGFVGYSGNEQQYFLGDSPQLSLDMELLSDYDDPNRSQDDWQIDFYPDPTSPRIILWQLGSLTVRPFEEAEVAAGATESGYFLEAALPWSRLGTVPQAGDRIGLAANVNDNDTPETNAQECIISTASGREWDDPTTWGTLFLRPPE